MAAKKTSRKKTYKKITKNRATRRKRKRRKANQPGFLSKYSANILGVLITIFSLLGLFKAGIVGVAVINIVKFFCGDLYLLGLIAAVIAGIWLTGLARFPKMPRRYFWGGLLFLLGILIWMSMLEYVESGSPIQFVGINWQRLSEDFASSNVDSDIGGGMISAAIFQGLNKFSGVIGSGIVATLIGLIGIFVFFNISASKFFGFFKNMIVGTKKIFAKTGKTVSQVKTHSEDGLFEPDNQPQISEDDEVKTTPKDTEASETEPHPKISGHDITISGMPVSSSPQKSANPPKKNTPEDTKDEEPETEAFKDVQEDSNYKLPGPDLLTEIGHHDQSADLKSIDKNAKILQRTLDSFGVKAEIKHVSLGPSVTKYELHPAIGVKVSRIVNLADDIALALAAKDIRIEAPIPGKSLIGIEVPNKEVATVSFKDVIQSRPDIKGHVLTVPLGKDVNGKVITADLTKMPHLLIAGSTGSGKSVAINVIITSILMDAKPSQVKLMLIDPKKVELGVYNGIPHLLSPVVSQPKKAARALQKVVSEMEKRYELFAKYGQRKISTFNEFAAKNNKTNDVKIQPLPYIVVIVDELSDLMMTVSNDVEAAIIRLAQMGRAAGIHMILATQRPSVDVITGLIKANVPSRIAFAVSSGTDSRTIIDSNGAEKLLGRGDMLFLPIDRNTPIRVQGAFISDKDVQSVVKFITDQQTADYDESMVVSDEEIKEEDKKNSEDELFGDAIDFVVDQQKASTSLLQRHFRIGYNRAARLIDDLQKSGIIGPQDGSRPRQVYKEKK